MVWVNFVKKIRLNPLAERMRPLVLEDYIGQSHVIGDASPLRKAINQGVLPSIILWGPPGVGKTTLAQLIAQKLNKTIYTLSAISSGVKDVREVIEKAESNRMFDTSGVVLFIDEIHRFSKAQQDSLLSAVEKGTVSLIGATTENPSFEVIRALLSRCQVYTLESHKLEDLKSIVIRAIEQDSILSKRTIVPKELTRLIQLSGGDARKLLNLLELLVNTFPLKDTIVIDDEHVDAISSTLLIQHDKAGEQHYDIASAFIKSIRGSDPNASVYWLARLIEGGEDPKFIARRMVIAASEDIGLANPNGLLMANAAFDAVERIGWPESRIILSQCAIYLANSEKGNVAYRAINEAQELVKKTGNLTVPLPLRNAPTQLMKELGYGDTYQYAHDFPGNFVSQEFLPEAIIGKNFIHPGSSRKEQEIQSNIQMNWKNKYSE